MPAERVSRPGTRRTRQQPVSGAPAGRAAGDATGIAIGIAIGIATGNGRGWRARICPRRAARRCGIRFGGGARERAAPRRARSPMPAHPFAAGPPPHARPSTRA
ncbi:hypothetical protein X961_5546 [Burkholderia pseudomallei MSHR5613]|nr:hypothetical protein X961_5546 [Burkholderia pseudomallei MSHR5613]